MAHPECGTGEGAGARLLLVVPVVEARFTLGKTLTSGAWSLTNLGVSSPKSERMARPTSSNGGPDASMLRASLKIPRPGASNANFSADERDAGMFPVLAASQSTQDML